MEEQRVKDKHTPGPWQYLRSSTSSTDHYDIMPAGQLGGWKDGRYLRVSGAIDKHDAALIAAAPELLEACEGLLGLAERHGWLHVAVNQARAAIAKAKGEQP